MYLHEDRENFKNIMEQVSNENGRTTMVIEKDYYVTLILKLLSEQFGNCVFKGGTSYGYLRYEDVADEVVEVDLSGMTWINRNVYFPHSQLEYI